MSANIRTSHEVIVETPLDESQYRIRMEERARNKQRIKELYEEDDAEVWF